MSAAFWRLASVAAFPRAVFAKVLAPLSHILIKGFFLVQGFFIGMSRFFQEVDAASVFKRTLRPYRHTFWGNVGLTPFRLSSDASCDTICTCLRNQV